MSRKYHVFVSEKYLHFFHFIDKGSSNNDVSQRVGGRGWEEADALISVGGA